MSQRTQTNDEDNNDDQHDFGDDDDDDDSWGEAEPEGSGPDWPAALWNEARKKAAVHSVDQPPTHSQLRSCAVQILQRSIRNCFVAKSIKMCKQL